MRKFVLLSLLSAVMSNLASATPCSGSPVTNFALGAGAPTLLSCTVTAAAGQYITNVTINGIGDVSNPSASLVATLSVSGLTIVPLVGTNNGTGVAFNTPLNLTNSSGQQVSWGGLSSNTDTTLTSVRLDFTITPAVTAGSVNNISFDINNLTGTSGTASTGCNAGTQVGTGTQGCGGANQFVSGVFFTSATQPPSNVPEPATLSLMGGALVALGLVARRRSK